VDKLSPNKILISVLLALCIFGGFKYLSGQKDKQELARTLSETRIQLLALEEEKQNLLQTLEKVKEAQSESLQKNMALKENLRASNNRLKELFAEFDAVKNQKVGASLNYAILKAENKVLREKRQELFQENQSIQKKLSSVVELKKAIRELKARARLARIEIKKRSKELEDIEGNAGFFIKSGKSTYPSKVRIEVMPAFLKN